MSKTKSTGLGRGLGAIFLENSEDKDNVTMLRLSEIEPNPDQPRREFKSEALQQLADSIAANGLIQPIVVRTGKTEGYYEIIAGERRWRASKMAGLTEIPVIVKEMDDKKAAQFALIENIQRESLTAIEEANAFKRLINEYLMTQEELANQIGKSRSLVANTLRLLDLPEEVAKKVASGELSAGHARAILALKDKDDMIKAADAAISRGMNVRQLERYVKTVLTGKALKEAADAAAKADEAIRVDYTAELANKMTSRLGQRVTIQSSGKKKKVEIEYDSDDELEALIKRLCGDNIFDE